jgi:hypothetical protein
VPLWLSSGEGTYFLVHNVRQHGNVQELRLAWLGERTAGGGEWPGRVVESSALHIRNFQVNCPRELGQFDRNEARGLETCWKCWRYVSPRLDNTWGTGILTCPSLSHPSSWHPLWHLLLCMEMKFDPKRRAKKLLVGGPDSVQVMRYRRRKAMRATTTKNQTRQIQLADRRESVRDRRKLVRPVVPPPSRWSANDCIRLSVAIPAITAFVLFISAILWCIYKGIIDPGSLGNFTEKAARAGFSGNGLLGVGLLIVIVLLNVLWSGKRTK